MSPKRSSAVVKEVFLSHSRRNRAFANKIAEVIRHRSTERRLVRAQGQVPAYRCRTCEGYDTLLTGTVFEKTRQRLQTNLNETAPTDVRTGTAFEADELYQNAGENKPAPS